jgi:uncharacterized protein (TIGR02588 family)
MAGGVERSRTPVLEWCFALLGAGLTIATVGVLLQHAGQRDRTLPDIGLAAGPPIALRHGVLVPFTASNEGDKPASQVLITGTLAAGAGPAEQSEVQLLLLPARSEQRGGLFFHRAPGPDELTLRAQGFVEP